jgi:hypothetical protein
VTAKQLFFFYAMPNMHLIFDFSLEGPPTAELILSDLFTPPPMVEFNGETYLLRNSYQHQDGTLELFYHPLFASALP